MHAITSPESVEILIAEDSPLQAKHLAATLRAHGFRTVVTSNGREALAAARGHRPTMLISDVTMPEMDGYALCREIRGDPALADLPFILLTFLADPEDVFRGLECGADNFISKPCETDHLLARIQHLLSNHHLRKREPIQMGVEVLFAGRRHFITADRLQILNLLLSTYEAAVQKNRALAATRDELRALNEKLEAANHELDAFAQSVSHDLRAPLRAIGGFSDLLLRKHADDLADEPKRLLGVVCTNVRRMGQLIDDILLFSRTSRQPMRRQAVRMQALVEEVIETLQPALEGRNVEFAIGALAECTGDLALLRQVWLNLVGNAVKFTRPREKARIELGSERRGTEIVYVVRDNGVGFDSQYADRLFAVFERLHRAEEFEGTGIGLSIVQRIVVRHGGRIWAESRVGEGATFRFAVPA